MITLIVILYLFMALWISFSEMKVQTPKKAFKSGFSFPILLFVFVGVLLLMVFLAWYSLIGLFVGGAWIFTHMP